MCGLSVSLMRARYGLSKLVILQEDVDAHGIVME